MGLMNFLRNRAGVIIIFCISFAIVAFLLGDVMSYGGPMFSKQTNEVGSVNGDGIDYNEFNIQVEQTNEMYRQQMGGVLNPQMRTWAIDNVWNQFLNQKLYSEEIEKIGIQISKEELNDMVNGPNPAYQIVQAFSDPQLGFDRNQLNSFINQVKDLPSNHEAHVQWNALLDNIVEDRLNTKYNTLINNSVYVTTLEANDEYLNRNKLANFNYVLLDYNSVNDNEVTVTDQDYKAFYDEYKNLFLNKEETRELEYVLFDASPVAEDTLLVKQQIDELAAQLANSANDSLFAAVNSETKYPFIYFRKGALNTTLDSMLFNSPVGSVVGPVLNGGVFELAKIVDTRMSPDSVKASHILLNPTLEGGVDKAQAKADSIKRLVQNGENFAGLAIQYSVDEGSKINGGELGTFSRGMMVPEFENPVFESKAGDVIIVNSQFGVHIVKIEKVIGNSKVVKAAIIDKSIQSGKETIDRVYNSATQFLSSVNKNNFVEKANEMNLQVNKASFLNARQVNLNGVDVKRELMRWAFEAKEGDVVSQVYESENNQYYIVAKVSSVNPVGYMSLESVKTTIHPQVLNRVKANHLSKIASEAAFGASDLATVASKLGKAVVPVENVVLANPVIPGISQEPKVIGTVFGSDIQKISKPIHGNMGVYLVEVNGFVNPAPIQNMAAQKQQIMQANMQRTWSSLFNALQDNAKIVDNRARFF